MSKKRCLVIGILLSLSGVSCSDVGGPSSSRCTGSCYECGCPDGQSCGQGLGDPIPVCRASHGW